MYRYGRGDKPERTNGNERQADENTSLIPEPAREEARRYGHKKVTQKSGALHPRRFRFADAQRILEMPIEDIDYPIAKVPKEKKCVDEGKADDVIFFIAAAKET